MCLWSWWLVRLVGPSPTTSLQKPGCKGKLLLWKSCDLHSALTRCLVWRWCQLWHGLSATGSRGGWQSMLLWLRRGESWQDDWWLYSCPSPPRRESAREDHPCDTYSNYETCGSTTCCSSSTGVAVLSLFFELGTHAVVAQHFVFASSILASLFQCHLPHSINQSITICGFNFWALCKWGLCSYSYLSCPLES